MFEYSIRQLAKSMFQFRILFKTFLFSWHTLYQDDRDVHLPYNRRDVIFCHNCIRVTWNRLWSNLPFNTGVKLQEEVRILLNSDKKSV